MHFDIYDVACFYIFVLILRQLLQGLLRVVQGAIHIAVDFLVLIHLDSRFKLRLFSLRLLEHLSLVELILVFLSLFGVYIWAFLGILLRYLVQLPNVHNSIVVSKLRVGGSLLLFTSRASLNLIRQLGLVNVHSWIFGVMFLVIEVTHGRVRSLLFLPTPNLKHLFERVVSVKDLARVFSRRILDLCQGWGQRGLVLIQSIKNLHGHVWRAAMVRILRVRLIDLVQNGSFGGFSLLEFDLILFDDAVRMSGWRYNLHHLTYPHLVLDIRRHRIVVNLTTLFALDVILSHIDNIVHLTLHGIDQILLFRILNSPHLIFRNFIRLLVRHLLILIFIGATQDSSHVMMF